MASQTVTVSVLADTKKFGRAMKGLSKESGLSKLGNVAKKAAKGVALVGAAALAAGVVMGKQCIDAASNLQQSMGGVGAVFKESAGQVHKWAKSAASDMGLSKDAYNNAATIIGTTLKNAGIPLDQLGGKTNDLIGLSSDLAATFGGTVSEATAAMGSALRGEFEPLRRFGISLNQADINAKALAMSGRSNVKELTKQEKALATQALMYEQSADAQGAFAREANTLAGQQERLGARFENIKATLGTYLLPIMTRLTALVGDRLEPAMEALTDWVKREGLPRFREFSTWVKTEVVPRLKEIADEVVARVVPAVQSLATWFTDTLIPGLKDASGWIVQNRDWLAALAVVIGILVGGIATYIKVMALWKAATAAAAAVQIVFNAALSANPIGIIILAIAALVAGLVFFFTKTKLGQKIWAAFASALKKGWSAITGAFSAGWSAIKSAMGKVWAFIKTVWSYSPLGLVVSNWGKITGAFSAGYGKVKDWLGRALGFVKSVWSYSPVGLVVSNWSKIVTYVKSLPGKLAAGLGSLYSKLTSPFRKAFNAIAGFWNKTVGKVSFSVPSWVPGVGGKGWSLPKIPMLASGGIATRATLAMIGEGRESEAILPLSKLRALLGDVGNGRATVYEIHVHTGVGDPVQIGREVARVLKAFERANGGRRFA